MNKRSRGFAILIVLFGLAVVTALFAVSSSLIMTTSKRNASDARLAQIAAYNAALLQTAVLLKVESAPVSVVRINERELEIRDVSGLIDLNTAARPLLETLFDRLDVSADQQNNFFAWRSDGRRVLRTEDLARILRSPDLTTPLHRIVTVFSGRQGVAPEAATPELLTLMGWEARGVPAEYLAQPSAQILAVFDLNANAPVYLGTVSLRENGPLVLQTR